MNLYNNLSWEVINKYFENKYTLVNHHLDSYNDFFNTHIFRIINEKNPLKVHKNYNDDIDDFEFKCDLYIGGKDGSKLYFGKPIIYDKDRMHYMYPNEARLRNMTYAITIEYDVLIEITIIDENNNKINKNITLEKILLGRFPVMLHSDLCILKNMSSELKYNLGECKHDNGGYFIIDGKEKVVIPQEKFADNMIYIKENEESSLYSHSAIVRCASEDSSKPVRTLKMHIVKPSNTYSNNNIVIEIPNVKKPIPLFIVMRALGVISDYDIIEHCILNMNENKEFIQYFIPSVHDACTLFTQEGCIKFISTFTKYMNISYAMDILVNYLLPQIGEFSFKDKAFFLGHMAFSLLKVFLKIDKPTDRDSFKFKRVETSGILITDLFKEYYDLQQKNIQTKIDKELYEKEKKKLTENDIINAIEDNYYEFFKDKIVEEGFKKAFKGNWGAHSYSKKLGIVQDLNRLSYNSFISHLRRLNLPLDASAKVVGPRLLHNSQYGLIDPVDTPDGGNIGLHKSMSIMCVITTGYSRDLLVQWLRENLNLMYLEECEVKNIYYYLKVFINGCFVGVLDKLYENINELRMERRMGNIPLYTSISYSTKDKSIYLFTDPGRLCRPLFYTEKDSIPLVNKDISKIVMDKAISWNQLINGFNKSNDYVNKYDFKNSNTEVEKKSIIDYIDTNETESLLIANNYNDIFSNKKYTNLEIHPSLIFGVMGNQIIFPENNQFPRDLFSCGQSKQAVSLYHSNHMFRIDKAGIVLNYGQIPLIKSRYLKYLHNEELPYGENTIVAIMCYTGYNVEDAILINEGAVKRGLFRTTYYNMYESYEESDTVEGSNSESVFINVEKNNVMRKNKKYNYNYLDDNGLIKENTMMTDDKIVIGKAKITENNDYIDESIKPKKGQLGIVDKSYMTNGEEGFRIAKIRIREERIPAIGDKMASRAGQKGTIGLIIPECDMPFTEDGLRPDLIINPHAIPSRMTIGQLVECIMGKACCNMGGFGDCTGFISENEGFNLFGKILTEQGFHNHGEEILYNGMTGEQINSKIFMGPTYYMRLKHMVKDKINYRAKGPNMMLTRQPVQGRANDGGLRIGEMERDGVIAHGASAFLSESMLERGDLYYMAICNKTGAIAVYNESQNIFFSPFIDGPIQYSGLVENNIKIKNISHYGRSFSLVKIPYSLKLLIHELQVMNIQMRIITEDNIDNFESMSYSNNYKKLAFDEMSTLKEHLMNAQRKNRDDKHDKMMEKIENEQQLLESEKSLDEIEKNTSDTSVPYAPYNPEIENNNEQFEEDDENYVNQDSPAYHPPTTSESNNNNIIDDDDSIPYAPDMYDDEEDEDNIRVEENIEDAKDDNSLLQPEEIIKDEIKEDEKEKKDTLKEFGKLDEDDDSNDDSNDNDNQDGGSKKIVIDTTNNDEEPAVGNGKKIKLDL
mgnify:FL=1|tara:strand:+ start:2259 stop:6527 length:4269 start_codon:yes stop_codon:yes gene_type:complete